MTTQHHRPTSCPTYSEQNGEQVPRCPRCRVRAEIEFDGRGFCVGCDLVFDATSPPPPSVPPQRRDLE